MAEVTITGPGGVISPFAFVQVHTPIIGPIPVTWQWNIELTEGAEPGLVAPLLVLAFPSGGIHDLGFQLEPEAGTANPEWGVATVPEGTTVHLFATLTDPATGVAQDQGVLTAPWRPTDRIYDEPKPQQGGGGLTDEQSLQLSQTHASTFPSLSLDSLSLTEISNGPSGDPIHIDLPLWVFGVIVRIASVPEGLLPQTPDNDYWVRTLAVVRLYRGSDLWIRAPVHTTTKIVPFEVEGLVTALTAVTTGLWILEMKLEVTFLPGVTGQAFLMRTP